MTQLIQDPNADLQPVSVISCVYNTGQQGTFKVYGTVEDTERAIADRKGEEVWFTPLNLQGPAIKARQLMRLTPNVVVVSITEDRDIVSRVVRPDIRVPNA